VTGVSFHFFVFTEISNDVVLIIFKIRKHQCWSGTQKAKTRH